MNMSKGKKKYLELINALMDLDPDHKLLLSASDVPNVETLMLSGFDRSVEIEVSFHTCIVRYYHAASARIYTTDVADQYKIVTYIIAYLDGTAMHV